jgi:hypothetical protein
MPNDGMIKISSNVFTGSESSVTLSAIPQIYDHLMIMASFGDVSSSYFYINGTNQIPVYWSPLYANGGYASDAVTQFDILTYAYCYGSNGASDRASAQWWTFPFYSKTDNYKMVKIHSNSALSSGNEFGGSWLGTFGTQSALTSITINGSGNWSSGSRIDLYGLVAK